MFFAFVPMHGCLCVCVRARVRVPLGMAHACCHSRVFVRGGSYDYHGLPLAARKSAYLDKVLCTHVRPWTFEQIVPTMWLTVSSTSREKNLGLPKVRILRDMQTQK